MLFIILINVAYQSGCYYNRNFPGQILDSSNSSIYMDEFQGVGYGYWFKYQPLIQIGSGIQFTQQVQNMEPQLNNYLISAEFYDQFTLTIIHYLNIDKKKQIISHFVEVYSQTIYTIIRQDFNPLNYEGVWIFFGIQSNLLSIDVLFYLDELIIHPIQDQFRKTIKMRYYLGYYGTLINGYNNTSMSFNQFKGKLSNFIIITEQITLTNFDQIIQSCGPLNLCPNKIQEVIIDKASFNGNDNFYYDTGVPVDQSRLTLYFWSKANPVKNGNLSSFLLRVSQTQKYIDADINNQLLVIKYLQYTQPLVNGIFVQTYSYQFPTEDSSLLDDSGTQSLFDSELQEGLTNWHFIQFEIGRSYYKNTLFKIIVPKLSYTKTIDWNRKNYYFSGSLLYFQIGGYFSYNQGFYGMIQNFNLMYCYDQDMTLQISCHYSCDTCVGPSQEDCLTCPLYRVFQQNQCLCQDGYLEYQQDCQTIDYVFPSIKLIEMEYPCQQLGYDQCESKIVCSFGYFKYEGKCIKCPYFNQDNLSIYCSDCILNPNDWNFRCSTDLLSSDSQQVFINTIRKINTRKNPVLFEINLIDNNYQLKQCYGCSKICNPLCSNTTSYGIEKYKYLCQDGYFYQDEECHYCGEGCLCNQYGKCYSCSSGYVYDDDKMICVKCEQCSQCFINQYNHNLECKNCPSQYYLNYQNQCIQCGYQCDSCRFQKCLICQPNTFLSFDGINCQTCSIQNCDICFQYYKQGDQIYSTLQQEFNPIDITDINIITSCARCSDQFYLKENQCLKQSELPEIQSSSFDGCVTGVVINSELTCLIGRENSIEITTCSNFESNCLNCIRNYKESSNYCTICADGYYASLLQGQCIQCPQHCANCVEQNRIHKDAWRRDIKAFQYYFFKYNLLEKLDGEFFASDMSLNEVVCTSCNLGQRLYNNLCIRDCDPNCQECQVINGVAQCVKCHQITFGIMRSTNDNICLNCPYKCQACIQRNQQDFQFINPFFDYSQQSIQHYSNQCYQKFDEKDFLDNEIGVVVTCQKYEKCYNIIQISIDVFCNNDDYSQKGLKIGFTNQFKQENCFIDSLNNCIETLQNQQLFDFFNQKTVKYVEIILNLIQGQADICILQPQSLVAKMSQNVFSLTQSKLILTSENALVQVNGYFLLLNFTDYEFRNIIFVSSYKINSILFHSVRQLLFIYLRSLNLKLENIQIVSNNQNQSTYPILFIIIDPLSLVMNNFIISQNIKDVDSLFQINVTQASQKVNIQLNQFIIIKTVLSSVNIFKIYQQFNNQELILIDCKDVQISSSNLIKFSFITFKISLNDVGSIYIDGLKINDTTVDNSILLFGNNLQESRIKNVHIQNVRILNSTIFKMVVLYVEDVIIQQSSFNQSQLFTNDGEYTSVEKIDLQFDNIVIQDNSYFGQSSFIKIKQANQNITTNIQKLQLNNNYIQDVQSNTQFVNIVSFQNALIYIQCNYIYMNDVFINRAPGNPELALLETKQIEIYNFNAQLHNSYQYQAITKDVNCLKGFLDLYFIIYIYDFNFLYLKSIYFSEFIIIDYPAIMIQSSNVLYQQQSETIIMQDIKFQNNILLITQNNKETVLVQIKSQQIQFIQMQNIVMKENILDQYQQDLSKRSATTFMIESDQGIVQIRDSIFQSNFLINSTNSPLFIQSKYIQITNTQFHNNNVFNFDLFSKYIVWGYDYQQVSLEQLYYQDFKIQSNGGSGQFITQSLVLDNINVDGSYGYSGGSFFISTQANASIQITNSQFKLSVTSDLQNTIGGVFYIDGSKSILSLLIDNNDIQYVKSRTLAGYLYITLSDSQNKIVIQNSQCINCVSINGGFMYLAYKTLTSTYPMVSISSLTLQNPDIEWFGQNTFELTNEEVEILQFSSYLIYLTSVKLYLNSLQVSDGQIFGILYFEGKVGLIFNNSLIYDYQPYFTPLININHLSQQSYILDINNLQINNVTQLQYMQTNYYYEPNLQCDSNKILQFNAQYRCLFFITLINDQETYFDYFTYFSDDYKSNNFNCFQRKVRKYESHYTGMFQITNTNSSKINLRDLSMNYITYNVLAYGILSIRDFNYENNLILIDNLEMTNNKCDSVGCLLLAWETQQIEFRFDPVLMRRRNLYNFQDLANQSTALATVQYSKFINNSAINGSGIYSLSIVLLLRQCIFMRNTAEKYGGGLYFGPQYATLYLIENVFINNLADNTSGQGIYLQGSLPKLDDMGNQILDNGDQDVSELPQKLVLFYKQNQLSKMTFQNDSNLTEIAYFHPYKILGQQQLTQYLMLPAGQSINSYSYFDPYKSKYIPYNLSLRIVPVNRFNQRIYDMNGSELTVLARKNGEGDFLQDYIKQSKFIYNKTSEDFNLDQLIVYFNPYLDDFLELMFQCNHISIPIYDTNPPFTKIDQKNYQLRVQIKTFLCQLGEYYNQTNQSCIPCGENTYSVSYQSTVCLFKDDTTTQEVNKAQLKIQKGFWRAYYYSKVIDNCYHLKDNCIGGWGTGDKLCALGHVGALCEQCDLYNINGYGSFSVSEQYSCGDCSQIAGNALTIVLISIWTLISILMSVDSTVEIIDDHIVKVKLKSLGYIITDIKPSPAVLIKVFTNYIQIVSTISTFQLQLPSGISSLFNSVGNPIQAMAYSLDCFLIDITTINIIYFRIIWGLLVAFIYILIFLIGFTTVIYFEKTKYNVTVITTCFIYLYIFLQPNMVGSLISLISYRFISNEYWIQGNVSYRYDTKTHFTWLVSFVVPLLFIIGFAIPFILWYGIYSNKQKLESIRIKKFWGYLYNEYRKQAYYWETIKIIQREFIIIVLAYYEDFIPIKAALVFLCLFFYSYLTNIKRPYNTGTFNTIDAQSTIVCSVSVILATTIFTAQQFKLEEIVWPFYLIIITINILFVLKILYLLIEAYTNKLQNQINLLKENIIKKYPNILQYPILQYILQNQDIKNKRVKERFKKLKDYLIPKARLIIQFKKQNNFLQLGNSNISTDNKMFEDNKMVIKNCLQKQLTSPIQHSNDDKQLMTKRTRIYPSKSSEDIHNYANEL